MQQFAFVIQLKRCDPSFPVPPLVPLVSLLPLLPLVLPSSSSTTDARYPFSHFGLAFISSTSSADRHKTNKPPRTSSFLPSKSKANFRKSPTSPPPTSKSRRPGSARPSIKWNFLPRSRTQIGRVSEPSSTSGARRPSKTSTQHLATLVRTWGRIWTCGLEWWSSLLLRRMLIVSEEWRLTREAVWDLELSRLFLCWIFYVLFDL